MERSLIKFDTKKYLCIAFACCVGMKCVLSFPRKKTRNVTTFNIDSLCYLQTDYITQSNNSFRDERTMRGRTKRRKVEKEALKSSKDKIDSILVEKNIKKDSKTFLSFFNKTQSQYLCIQLINLLEKKKENQSNENQITLTPGEDDVKQLVKGVIESINPTSSSSFFNKELLLKFLQ
ncbi:hypothetical protein EHI8A_082900 [Entamoeba histolytica HM-1:IMSS-B]|uniref:Uncharacterized protein n=5 Tax=Entamoeba histolytica TaxID=5759 RepID=C4M673_ENTH1|nr:hypothetical protein EHI_117580 [Entamoeba histolytica HM-1:IMSS]EMH72810.1 hypothetical protein EHI8A_082900 [Entamoeba histolytica HM-1:IMSS-B]EMS14422.1 hypothetical protein KM1_018890 [Entamoeba histolytica HM-3:IMSS]ENY61688.1 hypothetical protein EHI7A_045890 [Entamoeba histolytica HM-1:IMSS-A]GAT96958.1 hypothetical protein CL6EHI_117580 [Entamoeba histolytica]EAL46205.1 hypothetical protein EHI_117580 [Entamoeba histolytica HM-1:IMSS]|eukprot:XP_651592.1 hypothetical protein EHI_117580 [Entamoeba histolytica HM-1:IMSS]